MSLLQQPLPLRGARLKLPLVDLRGALNITGLEQWQLGTGRDAVSIAWTLDLASPRAKRTELRFPVCCLQDYLDARKAEYTAAQMAEYIFGAVQPLVRARWVYRRLACKHSHLYDLVTEGVLRAAKGSVPRTGPGGGAVFAWETLVKFIEKRRVA